MRQSRLSRAAQRSLAAIYLHIAQAAGDETTADGFVASLRAQCEKLATLPGTLGRPRPDLGDTLRSFPFRGHVIVFRYLSDALYIVDILNEHQDIAAQFPDGD